MSPAGPCAMVIPGGKPRQAKTGSGQMFGGEGAEREEEERRPRAAKLQN